MEDWHNRHLNNNERDKEEYKRIYELSSDEADKAWQDCIRGSQAQLELIERSNIPNHIPEKWSLAAKMMACTKEDSYQEFCELLVSWGVCSWIQIYKLDFHIWGEHGK